MSTRDSCVHNLYKCNNTKICSSTHSRIYTPHKKALSHRPYLCKKTYLSKILDSPDMCGVRVLGILDTDVLSEIGLDNCSGNPAPKLPLMV
jgi:hypothetical protein